MCVLDDFANVLFRAYSICISNCLFGFSDLGFRFFGSKLSRVSRYDESQRE